MIDGTDAARATRRKIESLGTAMSLPTVRRALGTLEGEHASNRRGGSDDLLDIRAYESGDEARLIDWKISARNGRPMVVNRERLSSSHAYLLLDVGRQMTGTCPSGERAWQIAANALCMFAALSLRRSDDVSLVLGDASSITRVPFHGGLAQFERTLDRALEREWKSPRNIGALLDYAQGLSDRDALVVLATEGQALGERHLHALRRIAQTHPLVVIDVTAINPFDVEPVAGHGPMPVSDAANGRRIPAFLRTRANAEEVDTHRAYATQALERELSRAGARIIHSKSSEGMFHEFVALVSRTQGTFVKHAASPSQSLIGGSR